MNLNTPKYSIIIPTYNGISYLPACIETITSQDYSNYELIISDDHSSDGTKQYLDTLSHPNITVIYPPESLSMTEHWEWALSHASGEWQIFVGQDDGLQPYFFQLADNLTRKAKEKEIRTISSSRAYFFWEGCEHIYGNTVVGYNAKNKTEVRKFSIETMKSLLGIKTYFELPQMYTTSLFNIALLNEVKGKQEGKVFTCHPQDANLAAIACSLEKYYLKSYIPLGWVGSSPKSAGMSISGGSTSQHGGAKEISEDLKKEYLKKVSKSKLKYHEWAGSFSFGSIALYFWQALLMTQHLRTSEFNTFIKSKTFKTVLFSSILYTKKHSKKKNTAFNAKQFFDLLRLNKCNKFLIYFLFTLVSFIVMPCEILARVVRKLNDVFTFEKIKINVSRRSNVQTTMKEASNYVNDEVKMRNWF